jgi:AAA15 family ATPase/GTPase
MFVGGNATGKTNIIKAIKLLFELLFHDDSEYTNYFNSCLFTDIKKYEMEYVFLISKCEIKYSFEIEILEGKEQISSEKLYINEKPYFIRIKNNVEYYETEEKKIMDATDEVLFLRELYFNTKFKNNKILKKWFEFLQQSVYVNCYEPNIIPNMKNLDLSRKKYLEKNGVFELNNIFNELNLEQKLLYIQLGKNSDESIPEKKFLLFLKKQEVCKCT